MRPHRTSIWAVRPSLVGGYVRVSAHNEEWIQVGNLSGPVLTFTWREARLLAKRINQCLDATRKK